MKLFTKSMEPNTTLGVAERVAYMSGNIGIALINTIVATFLMFFYTDVMMLNAGIIGKMCIRDRLYIFAPCVAVVRAWILAHRQIVFILKALHIRLADIHKRTDDGKPTAVQLCNRRERIKLSLI